MNRIIEGDVLDVLRSLPREPSFDCVIADPPYNHGIWMRKPVDEYADWCEEWLLECMARLREGGLLYCYGWPEYLAHVAVRFDVKRQRWLQWCYGATDCAAAVNVAAQPRKHPVRCGMRRKLPFCKLTRYGYLTFCANSQVANAPKRLKRAAT